MDDVLPANISLDNDIRSKRRQDVSEQPSRTSLGYCLSHVNSASDHQSTSTLSSSNYHHPLSKLSITWLSTTSNNHIRNKQPCPTQLPRLKDLSRQQKRYGLWSDFTDLFIPTTSFQSNLAHHEVLGSQALLTVLQKRAPPVAELEISESVESGSLVDVDSESVRTVPSDFKSQESKSSRQEYKEFIARYWDMPQGSFLEYTSKTSNANTLF